MIQITIELDTDNPDDAELIGQAIEAVLGLSTTNWVTKARLVQDLSPAHPDLVEFHEAIDKKVAEGATPEARASLGAELNQKINKLIHSPTSQIPNDQMYEVKKRIYIELLDFSPEAVNF